MRQKSRYGLIRLSAIVLWPPPGVNTALANSPIRSQQRQDSSVLKWGTLRSCGRRATGLKRFTNRSWRFCGGGHLNCCFMGRWTVSGRWQTRRLPVATMNILVIEDEVDLAQGIVRAFRDQGYEVETAADGAD